MSGYFWSSSKPTDTQLILATLEQQADTINKMALEIKQINELVSKLTGKPKYIAPKPIDINDSDLFKMDLDEFIEQCLTDADHCVIADSDEEDVKELTVTSK
jgi:hypothetical protein